MNTDVEQLSCRELVELVTDYLEGALSAEERLRFDEHIGICDGCRIYLEQMRQTIVVAGRLSEESLAPGGRAGAARGLPRLAATG